MSLLAMKVSVLLVFGPDESAKVEAREAVRIAFPEAEVNSVESIELAFKRDPSTVPEILILGGSERPEIERATQALDRFRLPRWAVVAMNESAEVPYANVMPRSQWTSGILARTLRSSLSLHSLRTDNVRFRGDLASIGLRIVHDLRSPLGGIVSASEALKETTMSVGSAESRLIQAIFESAADLVAVIDKLGLWARAGAMPDVRNRFDMGEAFSRARERIEWRSIQAGATISRPTSWPEVVGDSSLAESVWLILLENALEHGGKSPKIDVSWDADVRGFRFYVQDSGHGIAPDKQASLFQPFHMLNEPNAPRGLGLPVMERLVSLQGGSCGYEANESGGRFYFVLAAAKLN